jgi:hypothetical protein
MSLGQPAWSQSTYQSSVVVVRRTDAPVIPVGIRGEPGTASCCLLQPMFLRQNPESLAAEQVWDEASVSAITAATRSKNGQRIQQRNHLSGDRLVASATSSRLGLQTALRGSGYAGSLRCLPESRMPSWLHTIQPGLVRVDVILEGPAGAVALGILARPTCID